MSNYVELLTSNQFLTFFRNSAMVSIFVVTITMLISVPAAFALARMRFWGSTTLATGVFLTYLIPETLLFMPLFKMFAVFSELTGHPADQPLVGAADRVSDADGAVLHLDHDRLLRLDPEGARRGRHHRRRVLVPDADARSSSRWRCPGMIAATIFAFTVSWAQFLYPLVFTTSTDQLVLPVGIITTLIKGDVFNWGQIMTGALLGAAPPLIIYAFLMDYYIAGLTAGATKG